MTEELYLLPLHHVFTPGSQLPLQIFEQRYIDMVRDVMQSDCQFGIVTMVEKSESESDPFAHFFSVGTSANIIDFDMLPNNLLGLIVTGERRFEVMETERLENGLWQAKVEFFDDVEDDSEELDDIDGLVELAQSLLKHPVAKQLGYTGRAKSRAELSWQLVSLLSLASDEERVNWLALQSADERIDAVIEWLEQQEE